jgi:glycosyltransferase involved in cell wall biosynthesis
VHLVLIGGAAGDREHARQRLGARLELGPAFVDRRALQAQLDAAHVVAGVFGTGDKAGRVVPFKVVHALASGRPVVTADTAAVRAVLGEDDGVFLVPAGDAGMLAARLAQLAARPAQLAVAGVRARAAYDRCFAVERSGRRLCELLEALRQPPAVPS